AAPVEQREPVAAARGPGERVREREHDLLRVELVARHGPPGRNLVVDAQRPRPRDGGEERRPVIAIDPRDRVDVPAAGPAAPALGDVLPLGGRRVGRRYVPCASEPHAESASTTASTSSSRSPAYSGRLTHSAASRSLSASPPCARHAYAGCW